MAMINQDLLHVGKKIHFDLSLGSQGVRNLSSICLQPRLRGGRTCLNQYVSNNGGLFFNVIKLDNNSVESDLTDHACLLFGDLMRQFTSGLSTGNTWDNLSLRCFEVDENRRVHTKMEPLVPLTALNLSDTCKTFANILERKFEHNGKLPVYLRHLIHLLRKEVRGDILDPDLRFILENHISFLPSKMREAVILLLYNFYDSLLDDPTSPTSDHDRFHSVLRNCSISHDWLKATKHDPVTELMRKYMKKKGHRYGSSSKEAFRFIRNFMTHGPGNSLDKKRRFRRYKYGRNLEVLIPHLIGTFIAKVLYELYCWTNRFKDHVRTLLRAAALAH